MSGENKAAKAALKEAKDFLTKKDFKSALRCCKKVLNADKNNYMALVFCGLCLVEMQQPDQALQAYKRAVESDPSQLTGWQGLGAFYEKQLSSTNESDVDQRKSVAKNLCDVYLKMSGLTTEPGKFESLSEKCVSLYLTVLKDLDQVVNTLQARVDFMTNLGNADRLRQSHAELVRVLNTQQIGELAPRHEKSLADSLQAVINDSTSIQNLEHLKINIRLLYKIRQMEPLCSCAIQMHNIFPDNVFALEWICKIYLEWIVGALDFESRNLEDNPEVYINKLLSLNPSSTLAQLAKGGYTWLKEKQSLEASKILGPILEKNPNPNFFGVLIMCQCLFEVQDYSGCEKWLSLAPTLLDKVKEDSTRHLMKGRLDAMSVKTFYSQAKFEKADQVLKNYSDQNKGSESHDMIVLQAQIAARLGQEGRVKELIGAPDFGPSAKLVEAILMAAKKNFGEALSRVQQFLTSNSSFDQGTLCEAMLLQGELLWKSGRIEESLPVFIKSAQLNPYNWISFMYLGRFYGTIAKDLEKARKCYQKSFSLNPRSEEVGIALSDIYREQEKWDENEQFLTSVTRQSTNVPWAHLRLGIHYLSIEEPGRAIVSLQSVLRSDPSNVDAWECLADAYLARGSYTAALKAYDHTSKLMEQSKEHDSKSGLHPRLQVATIKLQLGHFRDAIEAVEKILEVDPLYIPALKCLSECLIEEAKTFIADFLNRKAVDNCQKAINILVKVVQQSGSNQLVCSWKLLGDALSIVQSLPDEISSMIIPANLSGKHSDESLTKWELLNLAPKCYARSLQIDPENSCGWHDLALAYFHLAENTKNEDASVQSEFLHKSESCLRKAVAINPGNPSHWNLFGVVAFKAEKFALAQHAFIKSVSIESNSTAWTNLGVVYLTLGHLQLANKAFKESQNQDPDYYRGWVGQALLAEMMGCDAEAMDLFRHSTILGNELESSIGYANWVCRTLSVLSKAKSNSTDSQYFRQRYCLEKMHGVSVGIDCLSRYTDRVRDDPCGLNLFGLLLEKENLLITARSVLETAAKILEGQVEHKSHDMVFLNLGRVLYKSCDYDGSISAFKRIVNPDFESLAGLALASNKAGKFEDGFSAYKSALQFASNDAQRSHVLAAMATIAYKIQGGNAAKTLLFQSTQLKPTSMDGLLALAILGIKQPDATLIRAALSEMEKRLDEQPEYRPDYVSLKALTLVLQGKKLEARQLLCKAVHNWPESSRLRRALALFYLHFEQLQTDARNAVTVSRCAEIASGLGRNDSDAVEMSCLVGVGRTLAKQGDEGMKAAIKVAHTYPGSSQAWSVLVCAAFSTKTSLSTETLKRLVSKTLHLTSGDSANPKLKTWLEKYEQAFN